MMQIVNDWSVISKAAKLANVPVVIMVDQSDCPYCRRVESDFFAGIFASREFEDTVIFGKISIDAGEMIKGLEGERISTREFLKSYDADFTPTILFLDSDRNQLVEEMIGLTTPDFYGYYLEKAIKEAIRKVST